MISLRTQVQQLNNKIMDNKETEQEVNHGLSNELYTLLCTFNFEPKSMAFYNRRGQKPDGCWYNFLDSIDCMARHVKSHMGGNYGLADEYLIVKQDGIFRFKYFGDSSANIKKIAEADKESVLQHCVNGA